MKQVVLEARERGVLFDIGHGKGSFAFKTARAMLANGFYPDTISSDVHMLCINGPAFDQVTTMSKFLCMGMPLPDVVAASTVNAAMALQRPELGSLKPGSAGDATLISIQEGKFDYEDVVGEHLIGDRKIVSEGVVIGGRWWHPVESSKFKKARVTGAEHAVIGKISFRPGLPAALAYHLQANRRLFAIGLTGWLPAQPL